MVLLEAGTSGVESFGMLIGTLFIFILVLGLTYFTTKWIASYQKGHSYNKNLRVVETLKLTTNKYIQIVKAGDVYLVIGIGKDEITFLTTLTREQLNEETIQELEKNTEITESFSEILNKFKEHLPKK